MINTVDDVLALNVEMAAGDELYRLTFEQREQTGARLRCNRPVAAWAFVQCIDAKRFVREKSDWLVA